MQDTPEIMAIVIKTNFLELQIFVAKSKTHIGIMIIVFQRNPITAIPIKRAIIKNQKKLVL